MHFFACVWPHILVPNILYLVIFVLTMTSRHIRSRLPNPLKLGQTPSLRSHTGPPGFPRPEWRPLPVERPAPPVNASVQNVTLISPWKC